MAQATQLCQTFNFSWEMPVMAVIGLALAPSTLHQLAMQWNVIVLLETYMRKGMQAKAMKPALVAMGGELPKLISIVFGQ